MKELPDDELDKLFRKSAEELDSNFDPQDWNALKKRLDDHDGKTAGAWFKRWWPAGMLAILMLAGLTTYLMTNKEDRAGKDVIASTNQSEDSGVLAKQQQEMAEKPEIGTLAEKQTAIKNNPEVSENNTSVSGKNLTPDRGSDQKKKTALVRPEKLMPVGRSEITHAKQTEHEVAEESTKSINKISKSENRKILPRRWSKTGGVYLAPNHSIGRRGDGAFISKNDAAEKSQINTTSDRKGLNPENEPGNQEVPYSEKNRNEKEVVSDALTDNETDRAAGHAEETAAESRLKFPVDALKSKALVWGKNNKLPVIPEKKTPQVSETAENVSAGKKEPEPKFAVRFGFSPDISSTGLKNLTKPGTAVSLLIEYSFLPKLYFQTGLVRSSKVYNAKAGEYEWPDDWNNQKARPTSIDALCKVIEIPLNLRFDISQNERSRWFVSAGASSYYMQKEKYDYNYPAHSYGILWPDYKTSTGWYWLSHLNASAGFEYRFSKKLSLLAEPYVRVPVKKVGYGKVDLFSAGMWFSIRYTPVFKN
jgi:hypothetical protein